MSKKIIGASIQVCYDQLKRMGYTVTAFLPGWFRAESGRDAYEFEYDSNNYITRISWC